MDGFGIVGVLQMANGQSAISRANAEHYTWGQGCDGWYLVKNDQMTIIEKPGPNSSSFAVGGLNVDLDRVHLTAGKVDVPLRSTQVRDGGRTVEYHRLENSGRIVIVLYADKDVILAPEH